MPLASPGLGHGHGHSLHGGPLDPLDPLAAIPHIDSDEDDVPTGAVNTSTLSLASASHAAHPYRDCVDSGGSVVPPKSIAELSDRLLAGGVQLPGVHDVTGRPLVLYDAEAADAAGLSTTELATALYYFMAVPRKEVRREGVTLLAAVDSLTDCDARLRRLDEALCLITHVKMSSMLVCQARGAAKPSTASPVHGQQPARGRGVLPLSDIQYHILGDGVALRNFLTDGQLPESCGGALRHDHALWVAFYQELEPFLEACQSCGRGLVGVMSQLSDAASPAHAAPVSAPTATASAPSTPVTTPVSSPDKIVTTPPVLSSLPPPPVPDTPPPSGSPPPLPPLGCLHAEQSALCRALSQPALLRLRREGPRVLAKLRHCQGQLAHSEDVRLSLERAERLFAEVERAAVRLEQLGESRRERLRQAARLRALHEETSQVLSWLTHTGEDSLQRHANMASTLPAIREQELEFDKFYFVSMRHLDKGSDLLEAAGGTLGDDTGSSQDGRSTLSDLARSLRLTLRGFSDRLEGTRERLEDTSRCFHLLDRALGWAVDMGKGLSRCPDWKQVQHHLMAHPPPDQQHLNEMLQLARKLGNDRLLEQCKIAHSRCQETLEQVRVLQCRVQVFESDSVQPHTQQQQHSHPVGRRRSVGSAPLATPGPPGQLGHSGLGPWDLRSASSSAMTHSTTSSATSSSVTLAMLPGDSLTNIREEDNQDETHASHGVNGSPSTDSGFCCCSGGDSPSSGPGCVCGGPPQDSQDTPHHRAAPGPEAANRHILRRSCSWQYPVEAFDDECNASVVSGSGSADSSNGDEHKLGYFSSLADNATEPSEACPQSGEEQEEGDDQSEGGTERRQGGCSNSLEGSSSKCLAPVSVNSHLHCHASNLSLNTASESSNPVAESQRKTQKTLLLIMREMIQTERDYVRSLEYVIENYIPELVREDIPQALRGQRNVIFGNIEKIFEFHSQLFLRELERCEKSPLSVGQSFLRHENKFYLYALYNKNKPKSDALMSEYGSIFFKSKQVELGDRMDLASYLLKPVQRMGKYALLLQQLLKAAGTQQEQIQAQQQLGILHQSQGQQQQGQLSELAEADQMVRFQLRHGNDLLAMDSLRDCDVNVKEQGRLLRQNEFLVWQGRGKKCLRHVFLFEELILFSKARRFPDRKNLDLYIYKHSIKMTDIGLTARLGDSSTRFEIWFRKRKPHDIFTLQAASQDVKQAWTEDISQLLWKQAMKNREVRLAEMSSMGIGNKPCLDIRPSADQISDRSVSIAQLSKGPRLRGQPSVPLSEGDRTCARRPHSVISVGSSSGASSSTSSSASSHASSSSNSLRSRPGDTSLCSAESGIISDMSEGTGSRWSSGDGRGEGDTEKKTKLLPREARPVSPHLHHSETEDICIKL